MHGTGREEATRIRGDLSSIVIDGMAFSVMVGCGERVFQQCAKAYGHGDVASWYVATLPMAIASVPVLLSSRLTEWCGSQKRWVILGSVIQALSFAPLAIGGWTGSIGLPVLFVCASLYYFGGNSAGPAWSSWMETLVPARVRERFFGRRQAMCQVAQCAAIVAAGAWLAHAAERGETKTAFGVLFASACLFRFVSIAFLVRQSEPEPLPRDMVHVSPLEVARRLVAGGALRKLFAYFPFLAAVHVAHSSFVPWALGTARLGEGEVQWLLAAEFLGRIAALPVLGTIAKRRGAMHVLRIGCAGLTPVALLWLAGHSFAWLAVVQFAGGVAWGAIELGSFLLFFEVVPLRERTAVVGVFFLATGAVSAAGSLAGSAVLAAFGGGAAGFAAVFVAATLARGVTLLPLRR
ncbi:MAG: hypothetical protein HMLKMBBP_02176 [Planctomycetes bacterium]|nr:hypothetical protein [Planctomycetota bacterium]